MTRAMGRLAAVPAAGLLLALVVVPLVAAGCSVKDAVTPGDEKTPAPITSEEKAFLAKTRKTRATVTKNWNAARRLLVAHGYNVAQFSDADHDQMQRYVYAMQKELKKWHDWKSPSFRLNHAADLWTKAMHKTRALTERLTATLNNPSDAANRALDRALAESNKAEKKFVKEVNKQIRAANATV